MSDGTFATFLSEIWTIANEKGWRYGQALFNHLLAVKPGLAEKVRATPLDPFFRHENTIDTELLDFLYENWSAEK